MQEHYPKYITIQKAVGETPLVAVEHLRESHAIPVGVPMAYAGRLDPMASGTLLVLIGDECKRQNVYHSFDKEYRVEVLLGASSDTGDVLGLIQNSTVPKITETDVRRALTSLIGALSLPYPHFSSKTVRGKPLHVWALEHRLSEIDIPTKHSRLYKAVLVGLRMATQEDILHTVRAKIETIPEVHEESKALGADFRRDAVRASWDAFETQCPKALPIITMTCIASSGTYMRSLALELAKKLGTTGLAYSIHRTRIGKYIPLSKQYGFWIREL